MKKFERIDKVQGIDILLNLKGINVFVPNKYLYDSAVNILEEKLLEINFFDSVFLTTHDWLNFHMTNLINPLTGLKDGGHHRLYISQKNDLLLPAKIVNPRYKDPLSVNNIKNTKIINDEENIWRYINKIAFVPLHQRSYF